MSPKAISFKLLLEQLRQRLGKKPAPNIFRCLARWLNVLLFIGQWLGEATFNAENIAMLRRGNSANAEPIKTISWPSHPQSGTGNCC